jgi:hypothetical protein
MRRDLARSAAMARGPGARRCRQSRWRLVLGGSARPALEEGRAVSRRAAAGIAGAGGWRNSPAPGSCCTTASFVKVEPSEPTAHNALTTRSSWCCAGRRPDRAHQHATTAAGLRPAAATPSLALHALGRFLSHGRGGRRAARGGSGSHEVGQVATRGGSGSGRSRVAACCQFGPLVAAQRSNSSFAERSGAPPRRCRYLPVSFPGACRRTEAWPP